MVNRSKTTPAAQICTALNACWQAHARVEAHTAGTGLTNSKVGGQEVGTILKDDLAKEVLVEGEVPAGHRRWLLRL